MTRDRFLFVASESEEGRDAFVRHPVSREEGRVLECTRDEVIVLTAEGERRCWDFRECDEISRARDEWPRR